MKRIFKILLCVFAISGCSSMNVNNTSNGNNNSNSDSGSTNEGNTPLVLTGNGEPTSNQGKDGDTYIDSLTGNKYVKENGGWVYKSNVLNPDTGNETTSYAVIFNSDGGTAVATQVIKEGEKITKPDNPTKNGYEFLGWTYNGNAWNFATDVVTSTMTLVASWQSKDTPLTYDEFKDIVLKAITQEEQYLSETNYHLTGKYGNNDIDNTRTVKIYNDDYFFYSANQRTLSDNEPIEIWFKPTEDYSELFYYEPAKTKDFNRYDFIASNFYEMHCSREFITPACYLGFVTGITEPKVAVLMELTSAKITNEGIKVQFIERSGNHSYTLDFVINVNSLGQIISYSMDTISDDEETTYHIEFTSKYEARVDAPAAIKDLYLSKDVLVTFVDEKLEEEGCTFTIERTAVDFNTSNKEIYLTDESGDVYYINGNQLVKDTQKSASNGRYMSYEFVVNFTGDWSIVPEDVIFEVNTNADVGVRLNYDEVSYTASNRLVSILLSKDDFKANNDGTYTTKEGYKVFVTLDGNVIEPPLANRLVIDTEISIFDNFTPTTSQYNYCVMGQFLLEDGETMSTWGPETNQFMTPATFKTIKNLDSDLATILKDKEIEYLYVYKNAYFGLKEAGWQSDCVINNIGCKADGSYCLKITSVFFDEEENKYVTKDWIPDPGKYDNYSTHLESLTPDTLYLPPYQDDPDEYGIDWYNNPVCIGGAGQYTVVFVKYKTPSDYEHPGYGLALIKTKDMNGNSYIQAGEPYINYFKNKAISVDGAKKGTSDLDELLTALENDNTDFVKNKYGEKFFLSFVQDNSYSCQICMPGFKTFEDNSSLWLSASPNKYKLYSALADAKNDNGEYQVKYILENHQSFFESIAASFGEGNDYALINNLSTISSLLRGSILNLADASENGLGVPLILLVDLSTASSGSSVNTHGVTSVMFDYTQYLSYAGYTDTANNKARLLLDCWNYSGIFTIED